MMSEAELADIFDGITSEKFKTDTEYVEKIYDRVVAFKGQEQISFKDSIKISINVLIDGDTFVKYCRRGKPHKRYVFLSQDEKAVCWGKNARVSRARRIKLEDVREVRMGHNTTAVL